MTSTLSNKNDSTGPTATPLRRASLHTLGCRLNQSETSLIAERLREAGYEIVSFGQPADLGVINTCTVTREADAKSRQLIRSFIRKNPEAYTAVIGCYSQVGYLALSEIEGIDLIVGNQEKLNILDYAGAGKSKTPIIIRDAIERDDFTIAHSGGGPIDRRANLKIQDGCSFTCSYCIIPTARGRSRSRAMDNLVVEARSLVQRGAKEIVLTGVNLGTYSYEGQTVLDVVNRLNELPGLHRIRISSIEPTTIPDGLFRCMNDGAHALVPYLHIPLQSGSDRVLRLMDRIYTRQEFLDFILRADAAVDDLCIGTDVMAGMPGEEEADFEATCELITTAPIAYAHVFKYSQREGTPAAAIHAKVSPDIMNRRSARLRKISEEKRTAFFETLLDRTVPVLFEQEEDGFWYGYTANYARVSAPSTENLKNEIRAVRLERTCGDVIIGSIHD